MLSGDWVSVCASAAAEAALVSLLRILFFCFTRCAIRVFVDLPHFHASAYFRYFPRVFSRSHKRYVIHGAAHVRTYLLTYLLTLLILTYLLYSLTYLLTAVDRRSDKWATRTSADVSVPQLAGISLIT